MTTSWWTFDFYYSAPFWAALAVVVPVARLLAPRPRAREAFLLAASCLLLLALPHFGPRDLAVVLAVSAGTFALARALTRLDPARDRRARRWIVVVGVASVLGVLAFFKYRFLQAPWAGARSAREPSAPLFLIGVSYFSFKAIHVLVESYKGSLPGLDALRFFHYMTFFPSFISGPISRYGHFFGPAATGGRGSTALGRDLRAGGRRIVDGLFKKFVLVKLVFPYALQNLSTPLAAMSAGEVAVGLYACALYFYFDFAGYSDLAIGTARLMGIPLPENFNWPFLQKNIRDVWSNWHMSLTGWLIDYVYWPVVRKLRNVPFFRPRPVLLSIVGMNVTFVACGMWHGEAPHFVVWGVYHGLGISGLNLYQRWKRRIRSGRAQRWFASRYSRWAGAVLTFHFFAAGLALFVLDTGKLRLLLSALLHPR